MTETPQEKATPPQLTPFKCIQGALISSALSYGLYNLTIKIATSFAAKPLHSDNRIVLNISAAVRTLVVGIVTLGMGIFGLVAVGLIALAIQLIIKSLTQRPTQDG